MASLRDTVKDYQDELRDGIAWVAFWKERRSWKAEYFHLDMNDTLYPEDRNRLEEIKHTDPTAVILNSYYCGHLGENMSLDELTAGVRYLYENGMNSIDGFIGAHDDRLPPELIEEARAAAHAAGLPFSEKPYRDGEDFDPYIFDGSMSIEDYELMHRMIEKERSDQMNEKTYSSYDFDRLEAAEKLKIERTIYFESSKADISALTALPLAELMKLKQESAAAEQAIFESLQERAAAWEQQAGNTLFIEKAIEYARVPEVAHTSNEWQAGEYDRHTISNRVYQMNYHIYENTRYDKEKQESVPYSWSLTWSVRTNSPETYRQAKIAGQDKKVFADKAAMEKYLNGRIKAYANLFTEISPSIPKEYAENFKVNGVLLPGYTIEGEEIKQPEQAPEPQPTKQRNENDTIKEQFAIMIDSRSRFETGKPGGVWLPMPATKEQLHEAMRTVGITADNPQNFFIRGYSDNEDRRLALPYDMVCAADIDSLNFLATRLETLDAAGIAALNASAQRKNGFENIGQIIDFTYNEDFFVHIPEVHSPTELGDYYLNKSGMVQMPDEWKGGIDLAVFGKNAAEQEKGSFTEYGYIMESGDDWEQHFEGREVPLEHRIMSYPQPNVELDAAPAVQTSAIPEAQPRPVIPIILTSEKPAEKLKEITDRLEQGISELFNSERYTEYLRVMSKFHNYSFNNTLLIAMQKPDASLIAGFSAWKNNFGRNVMKGEKGIKILAPSPFKIKKEMEKIDKQTGKPVIGTDGKPVTEEQEITIPAFKVVSVFDVSQTEGKEIPNLAVDSLTGDVERYKDVFAALEKTSPVPVGFEKIEGGAHGYYHLEDKRIALNEGMSELQTLKTLIHEIAHAKLHDIDLNAPKEELENRPDRRTREVQAESVAYTVCQHYGLDTSDYSFGYVAGWSAGRELSELKSSLETIRSTAAEIINSIDEHIAELQKEQEQTQDAPPQEQSEISMPDATISVKEIQDYGYSWEGMLPLQQEVAERLFAQDTEIFRIYEDGTEGAVTDLDDLREHAEKGGLFGIEKNTWEALHEYNAMKQQLQESEPTKEALLLYGKEDSYGIYQLARREETRDLHFEPYDRLQATGHMVDKANYELIYTAPLTADMTLDSIYEKFNIDHPKDFKGHSLSVSDIVVLHRSGENTAHYVDSFGFQNVPEFLQEKQPQLIPDEHLTGEKIETPRGSFSLTSMGIEQMREAGYGLHHTSQDGQYHIMGNGTRAFAVAVEQPEKVNPLKHIEDTVEQNDNSFDGLINNMPQTPTVDALEQKAKAGEVISLADLAEAIKNDRESGKGKGKAAAKEEKPSIRAQLKKDKERAANKKAAAKTKNHDLEV